MSHCNFSEVIHDSLVHIEQIISSRVLLGVTLVKSSDSLYVQIIVSCNLLLIVTLVRLSSVL